MQISDDIFLGSAFIGGSNVSPAGDPSPMTVGVGPLGRVYLFDIVPAASGTTTTQNEIALTQTTAGAANLVLTANGTTTTAGVAPDGSGTAVVVLDCARTVAIYSTGSFGAVNFTVYGYDQYGQPMTQQIAGPANSTVQTTKCFKSVSRISTSAIVGTAVYAGLGTGIGLPYRASDVGYFLSVVFNETAVTISSTACKKGDVTSPATISTTDPRGYIVTGQTDGSKRLVAAIGIPALGSGPNATRIGAVGVTQF